LVIFFLYCIIRVILASDDDLGMLSSPLSEKNYKDYYYFYLKCLKEIMKKSMPKDFFVGIF
jgi:hypothetical protein